MLTQVFITDTLIRNATRQDSFALQEQFPYFTALGFSTERMIERREIVHSLNAASLIDSETYIALHARLPFLLMEQEAQDAQEAYVSAKAVGLTALCFSTY